MKLLFLDANIYLSFYNTNQKEFKNLLQSVVELRNSIFITRQIVHEVNRNKLTVFRRSIDNYTKNAELSNTQLPEHLDDDATQTIADWNKARKELETQAATLQKSLLEILGNVFEKIATSSDNISSQLQQIFQNEVTETNDERDRARLRKEMGNPPGKREDPLGDQLTWEQLLSNIHKVSELWFVTNDNDFFIEYNRKQAFNAFLNHELCKRNPKLNIRIFSKLSEALREYNKTETIKTLPSAKQLDTIEQEEIAIKPMRFYGGGEPLYNKPTRCPKCHAENSFTGGSYLRSQSGGLTWQYICTNCGFHFDTGDFFD